MGAQFKFLTSMILKVSEVKGHSKKVVLGVLSVVLIFGAIYWFSVLDKEQYLTQRNFRLLNMWSHEISNKIDSLGKVSELAFKELKNWEKRADKKTDKKVTSIVESLTNWKYSCNRPFKLTNPVDKIHNRIRKEIDGNKVELEELVLKKLCAAGLNNIKIKKEPWKQNEEEEKFSVKLELVDSQLVFKFESRHRDGGQQLIFEADLDLSEFVEKLTNEKIFKNVFLIARNNEDEEKKSKVIFQRTSQEYSWRNWENFKRNVQDDTWFNLFENKNSTEEKRLKKSTLDFAPHLFYFKSPHGERFAIFTQPINFPGKINVSNETLYIAGIVSDEQFRQSYLSISSTALFVAMVVFLGLVVALPFIRLSMMGSTDSLKSFHVYILLFAMSLGSGLITILFLDIGSFETSKRIINERMKESAENIKTQAKTELHQVLKTLDYADKSKASDIWSTEKVDLDSGSDSGSGVTWMKNAEICNKKVKNTLGEDCYPDYSLVFWMDTHGDMKKNWSAVGYPGFQSIHRLIERDYVTAVLNEQEKLWQVTYPDKKSKKNRLPEGFNFFLDPIISWSNGVNKIVASTQSQKNLKRPEKEPGKNEQQDSNDSNVPDPNQVVAALQFEFLSLMKDVVVPPGVGYVVVDDKDAKVLFHSSEQRALRENFLVETDDNQMLRDLIWAGEPGHVEGRYWGSDKDFYVLPFDDVPWTLVVYQDREILDSASLMALVIATSFFTIWLFILFGVLWLTGWLLIRRFYQRNDWLWPDQKNHKTYQIISAINCICFLFGLCICWGLSGEPERLLLVCLIISVIALIANIIVFKLHKGSPVSNTTVACNKGFFTLLNYPYSFSTMISTCLLISSVLPAVGIMNAVYQKEMRTVVKYQLLKMYQELNDTTKPVVRFSQAQNKDNIQNKGIQVLHDGQNCLKSDSQKPSNDKYGLLGFYPDFLLKSKWHIHCSNTKNSNSKKTKLDEVYQKISYYLIPLKKGNENGGVITENKDNGVINWRIENSEVTLYGNLRMRIVSSNEQKYSVESNNYNWTNKTISASASASLPIQPLKFIGESEHQDIFSYILYGVLSIIWVSFIYKIPQIVANKTLFLFRPRRKNAELPLDLNKLLLETTPNLIVVGYPGQGKARKIRQLIDDTKEAHHIYLNLRNIPDQNWASYIELQKAKCPGDELTPIIIIDQFECRCNEPLINQKKLELLEQLQYLSLTKVNCHVHVISNVYPGLFPINVTESVPQDAAQDQREILSSRWHALWDTFGLVYYAMDHKESEHYRYDEWLCSELGDHQLRPEIWNKMSEDFLRPQYQAIWQSITLDEQLALFHLAQDQFIHVKHPGLNSLLCKGLIHFSPNLRFMDDRFVSFVKYAGKRDQLNQFARSHRAGNWSIIKVPLGIIFILFFAFLAITQEEFRAIFPAMITLLPILFQGLPDLSHIFKGADKN